MATLPLNIVKSIVSLMGGGIMVTLPLSMVKSIMSLISRFSPTK